MQVSLMSTAANTLLIREVTMHYMKSSSCCLVVSPIYHWQNNSLGSITATTTKTQMSLHIRWVWSAPCSLLYLWKVYEQIFYKQNFIILEANAKTGFLTVRLIVFVYHYFLETAFYLCSIYLSALQTRNFHGSKQYEHWSHARIWGSPPQKNHKNIGFLSNTSPDPLKNHKATKLGHHRPTSEMPLNGVLLAGQWWPTFSALSHWWALFLVLFKKTKQKNIIRIGPPLWKLSGTLVWILGALFAIFVT